LSAFGSITPGLWELEQMARDKAGKLVSKMDSVDAIDTIGDRAGWFLESHYAGPAKNKRIARALGISPGMAKLLRSGRGWTVARLEQAIACWPNFQAYVFPQAGDLHDRIDRVLEEIAALRGEINQINARSEALWANSRWREE
jgi:hypothetical protein